MCDERTFKKKQLDSTAKNTEQKEYEIVSTSIFSVYEIHVRRHYSALPLNCLLLSLSILFEMVFFAIFSLYVFHVFHTFFFFIVLETRRRER